MSRKNSQVLKEYVQQFGKQPKQPDQLIAFSKTRSELPTLTYGQAKKVLSNVSQKQVSSLETLFLIGDEVLLTKDRTGIISYIGKVPEKGDGIWYGVELTSGTLGHNDGMIKGKRYFQTNGKKAMFMPPHKLRRKLTKNDKRRRNSYAHLSANVKDIQSKLLEDSAEQKQAQPSAQQNSNYNASMTAPPPMLDNNSGQVTLVFQNPNDVSRMGYSNPSQPQVQQIPNHVLNNNPYLPSHLQSQSPTQTQLLQQQQLYAQNMNPLSMHPQLQMQMQHTPGQNSQPFIPSLRKNSTHSNRSRGSSSAKKLRQKQKKKRKKQKQKQKQKSKASKKRASYDTSDEEDSDDDSDVSSLEDTDTDNDPTAVKSSDTMLKYILRQRGQYREGLLDVYANPSTHPLIVEAFGQMKDLTAAEQAFLWPALLKRWAKYANQK